MSLDIISFAMSIASRMSLNVDVLGNENVLVHADFGSIGPVRTSGLHGLS